MADSASTISTSDRFVGVIRKYSNNSLRGTDKIHGHSYGPTYCEILCPLIEEPKDVKILEIGIRTAAFLQVLAECMPTASIVGADISLSNVVYGRDTPNIKMFQLDCTKVAAVEALRAHGPFDVIIDDASHLPHHQVTTFDIFAELLKPGGVFIIEDLDVTRHGKTLEESLRPIAEKHGLGFDWRDMRSLRNIRDDVLLVARKAP